MNSTFGRSHSIRLAQPHDQRWRCARDPLSSYAPTLGKEQGIVGIIFRKAQNKIQDPAKLRRLIADLINREQWMILDADVKGDAYEGLLEKNAQDTKTGAGQYFTPRALIQAIVEVMHPRPGETICDPACGTGGFLLAAHDYLATHYPDLDREEKRFLRLNTLHRFEIVDGVTRLCAMNLLLHGIGPTGDEAAPPVMTDDSLRSQPGTHYRSSRRILPLERNPA